MAATIGVVGLGKMGLPVAVTLALRGHEVIAYDRDASRMDLAALSPWELGPDATVPLRACLGGGLPLRFAPLDELMRLAGGVFVVVDTPHGPAYEGITPLPDSRADFGYHSLISAVRSIVDRAHRPVEIAIMSTVLPGTIRTRILPLVGEHCLVYCPQFVAMGRVAVDLLRPEFTLLGCGERRAVVVPEILGGLGSAKRFIVSYETAELAKVVYNTFVSAKVTVSNLVQWMAHETGADVLDVFRVLRRADQRLTSEAYLGPGMGDGGPCHPRDNIALSWLFRQMGAGSDLFTDVMRTRQAYVEWLGNQFRRHADGLPLVLLGTAFKPGTDIQTGSSAVLLATLLRQAGAAVTTVATKHDLPGATLPAGAAAFFIGCPEPEFTGYPFPAGSVVVDPWCVLPDLDGVRVHRIGSAPVAYAQS